MAVHQQVTAVFRGVDDRGRCGGEWRHLHWEGRFPVFFLMKRQK